MNSSYIKATDEPTGDRTIVVRLSKEDMARAKFNDFDHALFADIKNGAESNTPIADQLLGLETFVRRIEEAK